ncbi:MAG: hypothetical protein LH629_01125, partial [Ignavibacteria bacterium]|nr:hypothetical protein [Ignavibacteria bacterium]
MGNIPFPTSIEGLSPYKSSEVQFNTTNNKIDLQFVADESNSLKNSSINQVFKLLSTSNENLDTVTLKKFDDTDYSEALFRNEDILIQTLLRSLIFEREAPFEVDIPKDQFNMFLGEFGEMSVNELNNIWRNSFYPHEMTISFYSPRPGEKMKWGVEGIGLRVEGDAPDVSEESRKAEIIIPSGQKIELRTNSHTIKKVTNAEQKTLLIKTIRYGEINEYNKILWQRFHSKHYKLSEEKWILITTSNPDNQFVNRQEGSKTKIELVVFTNKHFDDNDNLRIIISKDLPSNENLLDFANNNMSNSMFLSGAKLNDSHEQGISLTIKVDTSEFISDFQEWSISILKEIFNPPSPAQIGDLLDVYPEYENLSEYNSNPNTLITITNNGNFYMVKPIPTLIAFIKKGQLIAYGA